MKDRLLDALRKMDEGELCDAIYRDECTGALNRRAFQTGMSNVIALVDIDSLKWVNDHKGHREGDRLLRQLAGLLQMQVGDRNVYRISGDEFAVRANDIVRLVSNLEVVRMKFPWFSYGTGRSLEDADSGMRYEKGKRVEKGLRAMRGDTPPDAEGTFSGIIGNELDELRPERVLVGGSKG